MEKNEEGVVGLFGMVVSSNRPVVPPCSSQNPTHLEGRRGKGFGEMRRRSLAAAAAVFAAAAVGGVAYDHQTQHKLRRLKKEWTVRQAAVRLTNDATRAVGGLPRMTLAEVAKRDGCDGRPLYFSAGGRVYDATRSVRFRETYGRYAGRDATVSLSRLSMDPADVGRTDWDALSTEDLAVLDDWVRYFDQTYLVVCTLAEWDHARAGSGARKSDETKNR